MIALSYALEGNVWGLKSERDATIISAFIAAPINALRRTILTGKGRLKHKFVCDKLHGGRRAHSYMYSTDV